MAVIGLYMAVGLVLTDTSRRHYTLIMRRYALPWILINDQVKRPVFSVPRVPHQCGTKVQADVRVSR